MKNIQQKNSTPKKQYQQVLIAARTRNPQLFYTTVNRISPNLFFGCSEFNYLRPGGFLAMNGEIDAARWLLTHGACISHVAEGAALGGQIAFANELLEKGANINIIAQGATCSGHLEFARTLQENGANINFIAQGAAQGGHVHFARELIKQGANIFWVAQGAAVGGHMDFANELLEENADINWIARAAAWSGHITSAKMLQTKGANIRWVAQGAAIGGHNAFVNELLKSGADINLIAQYAAEGGHEAFARKLLLQGADKSFIARGAAKGGHQAFTSELLEMGARINWIALGATRHEQLSTAKKQLFFLQHFTIDSISRFDEFWNTDTWSCLTIEPQVIADAKKTRMMLRIVTQTITDPAHTTNSSAAANHQQSICTNLHFARHLTARDKNNQFRCKILKTQTVLAIIQALSTTMTFPNRNVVANIFSFCIGSTIGNVRHALQNRTHILSILGIPDTPKSRRCSISCSIS